MLTIGPGPDYKFEKETKEPDNITLSMVDEIRALKESSTKKNQERKVEDSVDLGSMMSDINAKKKEKKKKKKEKKKAEAEAREKERNENINASIIDIESFIKENLADEEAIDESIINTQKKGYGKFKKSKNEYKKEFSEELTLLYNLLDETGNFGKQLEKDLQAIRGSKVRGVSKYSNELAELVLSSKQSKLNILKEIAAIKKNAADLKLKADAKSNKNDEENNNEQLASRYLKNILTFGRNEFINNMINGNNDNYRTYDEDDSYQMDDNDEIFNELEAALEYGNNPNRSSKGNKYIEYEHRGVNVCIKTCIDTNDWEFVAIDKNKQQVDDYPLPAKRDVGRIKWSDDGTYATDSQGRMYKVFEYYLPDED